jgi:hypothetical protein
MQYTLLYILKPPLPRLLPRVQPLPPLPLLLPLPQPPPLAITISQFSQSLRKLRLVIVKHLILLTILNMPPPLLLLLTQPLPLPTLLPVLPLLQPLQPFC